MPIRAWIYVIAFYASGGLALGLSVVGGIPGIPDGVVFGILLVLTILAQMLRAEAPSHQLYHPAYIFIFSSLLLLDPFYFNLVIILAHLAEWLKERLIKSDQLQQWYIQPFNISMHLVLANSVWLLISLFTALPGEIYSLAAFVGIVFGALVYAQVNHLMVGVVIQLAREKSLKELKILDLKNVSTDFIMLIMGYAAAVLLDVRPWLILPAIAPLNLIYRALSVPQLTQRANTDPKTGLWNAEYFNNALDVEILRADRFQRPLTVVMADLDLLRNINNTYGHLAGDAVLIGVAKILRASFRDYDVVARFGGEEFSILIPESTPDQVMRRVELVREAIAREEFKSPISNVIIKATMSFGIAGKDTAPLAAKELVHRADIAVYTAKLQGRNCSQVYTTELGELIAKAA